MKLQRAHQERAAPWTPADCEVLMKAYDAGGYRGAYNAFPDRSQKGVQTKVQRLRGVNRSRVPTGRAGTAITQTADENAYDLSLPRVDTAGRAYQLAEAIARHKRLRLQQEAAA